MNETEAPFTTIWMDPWIKVHPFRCVRRFARAGVVTQEAQVDGEVYSVYHRPPRFSRLLWRLARRSISVGYAWSARVHADDGLGDYRIANIVQGHALRARSAYRQASRI